jgi:LmbE family N-acetylglucosaminyl deacetylase
MRLTFSQDRILAVMAHPDDAELLCAGTLARARADGAEIAICVMCRGDKGLRAGEVIDNLAQVRQAEATQAAKVLGAQLFWFGSNDAELLDGLTPRRALVEIYRQFRPTLVIAHFLQDYHPDHRAAAQLAEAASWFCASRGYKTGSPALETAPAVWFADALNMSGFSPHLFVDVSEQLELKKKMLACHQSQIRRGADRDFAPLTELMLHQAQSRGAEAGAAAAEAFTAHHFFKRARAW